MERKDSDFDPKAESGEVQEEAFAGGDILAFADYLLTGQEAEDDEREVYETWVAFRLGGQVFALPVHYVHEVAPLGEVTRVVDAPFPVRGVTSLRGQVLALVDLRASLGMGEQVLGTATQIMVAESEGRRIGLLVDRVLNVHRLAMSKVEEVPQVGETLAAAGRWLKGIYPGDRDSILMLDAEPLLRFEFESQEGADL
jgi:purine-binding chemotaxis protein CheW